MPSLSSLIVQRQVATIAEVEQAISRQVIHGGDLVTNLLEVTPGCEFPLTHVLAESLGIPSVPPGRMPAPSNEVLDIVPVEMALRYGIFPLRLSGKTLVVATGEKLNSAVMNDLAYMLGLDLAQVAAPLIRIREGIAAHYGVPLEPRQLRLVQRLDGQRGVASVHPPRGAGMGDVLSILPSNLSSGVSQHPGPPDEEHPPTRRKPSTSSFEPIDAPDQRSADLQAESSALAIAPPTTRSSMPVSDTPPRDTLNEDEPHRHDSLLPIADEDSAGRRPIVAFPDSESTAEEQLIGPATLPPETEAEVSSPLEDQETREAGRFDEQETYDPERTYDPARALKILEEVERAERDEAARAAAAASIAASASTSAPDSEMAAPWASAVEPESEVESESEWEMVASSDLAAPLAPEPEPAAEVPAPEPEPAAEMALPEPEAPQLEAPQLEAPQPEAPQPEAELVPEVDPPLLADGPPIDASPRPPGMVDRKAVANLIRREIGSRRKVAKTARKKGPFSRVDAERELETARAPEDVLDTFFAFGSQFFQYSATFMVHGDLAEGRDAWGPGADHLRVLGLGVPLDLPSSLAAVRKDGHVLLSRFDEMDLDRELIRDLERSRSRPMLAALIPLTVRGRTVAILYGDDAGNDVTLTSLGDLLGFSALASSQLERLALARKTKRGPFSGIVAPRAQPSSVAALARAFSLPGSEPQLREVSSSRPSPAGGTRPPRAMTLAGVGDEERILTPSEGTPSHMAPRVSPGATSVVPPRPDVEPKASSDRAGDEASEPDARFGAVNLVRQAVPQFSEVVLPEPSPDPAYAETAIADEALAHRRLVTQGYEELAAEQRIQAEADLRAMSSPLPPAVVPNEPSFLPPRAAPESSAPPPFVAPSQKPGFVKPIPRIDEEDASMLVAQQTEDWSESPRPSGLRHDVEPESQDGRLGSYHLVPRPAETRHRNESNDIDHLLERALAGGLEGEEALSELLRRSEHEFPKLIERFPGPLVVDRLRARTDLPPASECGPLLKVLVMARRATLPFMTVRSSSSDTEHRFWATHVLGELMFAEASNAILPRLFDDDLSVRKVARRAAQALAAAGAPGEPLKHSLDHTMRSAEEPMQRRVLAIEALSEIRVPSVVPLLVGGLRDKSEAISEAARTALMIVTRQDLGRLPDVWTVWWEQHRDEHRVEWLIQALTHDTASIRRAAGDELKMLTREYFGYYDDLPPRERERAQQRYADWWREDGQYRFR